MKPFFFGSSRRPLFGLYQGAQGTPARDVGVLLCNPFGHEAVRAHRAYRQLAALLARSRFHVLRFDYFGTGDSAGREDEGRVAQWLEDVQAAADELRDMTGVERLACVGLRLGATLAALAARGRADVEHLVLWDPVVNGASYVRELCRAHVEFIRVESPEARVQVAELEGRLATRGDGLDEALGFPLPEELRRELAGVDLVADCTIAARRVALVVSDDDADQTRLLARLNRSAAAVTFDHVPRAGGWNSEEALNSSLVPVDALQAIVARLS
jgi:pimeloyl-ACP methyl ester carboxylesterase